MKQSTIKCSIPWLLALPWMLLSLAFAVGASSTGMVLRVRTPNGSMERLQIPPGAEDTMSLKEALSAVLSQSSDKESPTIKIGSTIVDDDSQTLAGLGLKQGSIISLTKQVSGTKVKPKEGYFAAKNRKMHDRWDPFPDLAKDYESAMRKAKTKRAGQSGLSYGDLASLQSSLHVIEAQDEGPLKRLYMCANSAGRFKDNCFKRKKNEVECRVALLLGTVQRERADLKPRAKTSLSSQTESSQYCDVVKVHALWEPPTQKPSKTNYDAKSILLDFEKNDSFQQVLKVADLLGIRPIGWVFAYNDNRHEVEDSLPVYGQDSKTGALLQIANMKSMGRTDGSRFVTCAMDATTGSTEAFQLSDVCVQMIAEDLWDDDKKGRFVSTKHNVIVDGKETKELDSVLCLVNTAVLSHSGSFAGPNTNSVNKSGGITKKVKKNLLAALEANDDNKLLSILCDFNLLLSLEKSLNDADMKEICDLVRKWARGQKRGTALNDKLKMLLRTILDH